MKSVISILSVVTFILTISLAGCSGDSKSTRKANPEIMEAGRGEHQGDLHGEGQGEESGTKLGLNEVYDEVRKGTHLVLSFDKATNSFTGTVENVSGELLDRVRVEVHLSNGKELGPTTQVELGPGEKRDIELTAESGDFDSWSTHAEVGSGEHDHSHDGEHSHEGEHTHEDGITHEGEHTHEGDNSHEGHSHDPY